MKKFSFLSLVVLLTLSTSLYSFDFNFFKKEKKQDKPKDGVLGSLVKGNSSFSRELILGGLLKNNLEGMHFSKKKIDDDLSSQAYKEYLRQIDFGRQFLLKEDVAKLAQFEKKFDDQLISGNLKVVDVTSEILSKRMKSIKAYILKLLEKPFDLTKKEFIESDPEKRDFSENMDQLEDFWRRYLKHETLNYYIDIKNEQEGKVSEKKKKKKKKRNKDKKKEKLTAAQIEVEARQRVKKRFEKFLNRLLEEKRSDRIDKFYNSITKIFDPHTRYLMPQEKEDFDIDMSGKLEGIGALLREEDSYIKVERIIPGSASWKQKELQAEDIILKVGQAEEEPVDVVNMSLRDAVKLIRGEKGTVVRLTVKKPSGLIKVIPITRDTVVIEESYVKGQLIEHQDTKKKYGYIKVPKFYRDFNDRDGRNCTDDVKKQLSLLKKKNIDGLILDLRNNGGGALRDAQLISGLFFKKGPVVQVKDHAGVIEVHEDYDESVHFEKPMVVLINKFSASASEIVAAALQDYGRAIVVGGEYSHGKGTVQAIIDLDNYLSSMGGKYAPLGALKITIQKFYRITGGSTQYKGVTPDIILPDIYSNWETGERYLDHSLKWGKVKAVPFKPWEKYTYNLDELKKMSDERVENSEPFSRIMKGIDWFAQRKDETKKSLVLEDFIADREKVKKFSETLENEVINKKIIVTSLKQLKLEEDKERFKEYQEELQKDPIIEESLHVLTDAIDSIKK